VHNMQMALRRVGALHGMRDEPFTRVQRSHRYGRPHPPRPRGRVGNLQRVPWEPDFLLPPIADADSEGFRARRGFGAGKGLEKD
jgi:hypothetical protein